MKKSALSVFVLIIATLPFSGCTDRSSSTKQSQSSNVTETDVINVWVGSRTEARRVHEREVLQAALEATREEYGPWELDEHDEDYHGDRESRAFREYGHDLFVTTAGNRKLEDEEKIVIHEAIMDGILGFRVLIIRAEDQDKFARIETEEQLKKLRVGVPETWSDAEIFRHNGYNVIERGTYDDMFERLHGNQYDFTALGANEVEGVFADRADEVEGLMMVDDLLVYYPFPLLFYVNPDNPELADRIRKGMSAIAEDGTLDHILRRHNAELISGLRLNERTVFRLESPMLPEEMAGYQSTLLQ
ncbi:MAG: transporter substrate-binding domain-containing protein [Xanthomonadales bacterium]|nr:transporter substrate-binding domain-containing protein [Xanthomonadales bacterium]